MLYIHFYFKTFNQKRNIMNSEYIIIDTNSVESPGCYTFEWWMKHKKIYLMMEKKDGIDNTEWDDFIHADDFKDVKRVLNENLEELLYKISRDGVMIITESEALRIMVRPLSKKIANDLNTNDLENNVKIGFGDEELLNNPVESMNHHTFDLYWTKDGKDFETLHQEFCSKYV